MSTRLFPKHTVSTTQPVGGQAGDEWFNPTTNRLCKMLVVNGVSSDWRELSQPSLTAITANVFASLQTFNRGLTANTIVLKSTSKALSVDYKITSSNASSNGNTISFPFTVDNDENPCLVVTIAMNSNNVITITPTWTAGSITQTFTMLGRAVSVQTSIWYLAAPTVGTGLVSINLDSESYWEAGVSLFTGVNQSTPMDKFTTVVKPSLNGTSSGQSYISSHAYSGIANELIIAVISSWSGLTNPNTPSITTAYSTQTSLWELSSDGAHRGIAFFQPSSSSVDVSALYPSILTDATVNWVIASLKPATSISDGSGTLRLNGTSAGNTYTQFRSSAQPSANMTYTFPASAPSAGQLLSSDANGNLSWVVNSGGASLSVANTWTATQTFSNATYSALFTGGKVGIGTTSPGTALEVYGLITARPASTNDAVIIAGRAGGTAGYSITLVSGTLTASRTLTLPDTNGTLALKADTLYIGTTSVALNRASAALALTDITSVSFPSGATYATILQGSASATAGVTYTLPVADGTSGQALVTGGNGTLSWATASGGTTTYALTIGTGLSGSSSTFNGSAANTISLNLGNANTWTETQTFSNATYSALFTGGNVGIGTTTPAVLLHVHNTVTSGEASIKFTNNNSSVTTGITTWDGFNIAMDSSGEAALWNFENSPIKFATNSTERMRITSSGKVGIGTNDPGSALDVKGTLRLSGSTSGYVGFAPAPAAGGTTYTLPSADGASSQVLQTSGGGILSWATPRRVYSIPASAFTVTATTPATLQAVGTSNASSGQSNVSGGAFYELSFSDTSTSTSADVVLRASAHALDGNQTMSVKLVWYSTATTNAVRWAWDIYSGTTSNVVNGALALIAATTATVNSTTLRHNITTLTTLVGSNVPLEDSLVTLRISRLGADGADTLIGTANVIAVYVEFT